MGMRAIIGIIIIIKINIVHVVQKKKAKTGKTSYNQKMQ